MIDLRKIDYATQRVMIGKADLSNLFKNGLEYAPPVRGKWNIVHIGFLIPESHQIFVCAESCLRGVVLTAHEAGAAKRFSTIAVEEEDVLEGDMETEIIEGVSDIIKRLETKPKAILVYTSCIQHFLGCDLDFVYQELKNRFPSIMFTDCYMTPITRKSGITPDEKMRMQLYSLIEKPEKMDTGITMLGNVIKLSETSDIIQLIKKSGRVYRDICLTKTWSEYQELGLSSDLIYIDDAAEKGAKELSSRLGKNLIKLITSFNFDQIDKNNKKLANLLAVEDFDFTDVKKEIEQKANELKELMKEWKVSLDYTATIRPFSLARFLMDHGIKVAKIYSDVVKSFDMEDAEYLKKKFPDDIQILSPSSPAAAFMHKTGNNILAIGQKAAYFDNTPFFVNIIDDSGYSGYGGILEILNLMKASLKERKNISSIVQVKGWGCEG